MWQRAKSLVGLQAGEVDVALPTDKLRCRWRLNGE